MLEPLQLSKVLWFFFYFLAEPLVDVFSAQDIGPMACVKAKFALINCEDEQV